MKKDGFVFIETVIVIVVLTSSLLLLYSTFNKILQTEKTRVYYDDVNYVYRTWNIKNTLNSLNILVPLKDLDNKTSTGRGVYFVTLGLEYQGLFDGYEDKKTYFSNMLDDYEVKQIILLNANKIDNLKKCNLECSLNTSCDEHSNCNELYTNLSENMITYLKSIYVDIDSIYVLVVEYETCDNHNICRNYYSWVGV